MRALLVFFLLVVILTPGLLMGFLVSPWFFLILFSLLLLFPIFLAPMPEDLDSLGSSSGQESTGPLVWINDHRGDHFGPSCRDNGTRAHPLNSFSSFCS